MNKIAFAMTVVLTFLLLALGVTNSTLFVQATEYNIIVDLHAPKNKAYFTNDVPLSFSYNTNIITSPDVAGYSVVFCYNLDGQPRFDMFGNIIPSGETIRIGEFCQPVPLAYNSYIHVPNGSHSLFVHVTFWIRESGDYQNMFSVQSVSKVVNFTVCAGTPTSTPSPTLTPSGIASPSPAPTTTIEPTLTPEPFPTTLVAVASVTAVAVVIAWLLVYFKKRKREVKQQ